MAGGWGSVVDASAYLGGVSVSVLRREIRRGRLRAFKVGGRKLLRLSGILEMRRTDPDGKELPSDAYVFGTETGERRRSVHHAWEIAVLRAHGHEPELVRGKISPKSRALFQQIDLHMHDLRRECGSRLLEAGAGLHEVREWLGHTDISTTGRYLAVTAESLKRTLKRLEEHRATRRPAARPPARPTTNARVN
jgi:integrase